MTNYVEGIRAARKTVYAFKNEADRQVTTGSETEKVVSERLGQLIDLIDLLIRNTLQIQHLEPDEKAELFDAACRSRFGVSALAFMRARADGYPSGWRISDIEAVESLIPLRNFNE